MKIVFFVIFLAFTTHAKADPIEVALTFDDLPYVWDAPPRVYSNKKLMADLIETLAKHKVSGAFGFVNAAKAQLPANKEILDLWVNSGHLLGSHTWSHRDLNSISSKDYIVEINSNHTFLKKYGDNFFEFFRYPFLHEGNTQEKRTSVRQHLFKSGYEISQVTVDHNDWAWYAPFSRCLSAGNHEKLKWLRDVYNSEANENLRAARLLSEFLFKRQIKHIALFHPNVVTVEQLDATLANWSKAGAKFVSLQEAMKDEVYKIDPNVVRDSPNLFTNQVRIMRGLENPPDVLKIFRKSKLIESQLAEVCK